MSRHHRPEPSPGRPNSNINQIRHLRIPSPEIDRSSQGRWRTRPIPRDPVRARFRPERPHRRLERLAGRASPASSALGTSTTSLVPHQSVDAIPFPAPHFNTATRSNFLHAFVPNVTPPILVAVVLFAIRLLAGKIDDGRALPGLRPRVLYWPFMAGSLLVITTFTLY